MSGAHPGTQLDLTRCCGGSRNGSSDRNGLGPRVPEVFYDPRSLNESDGSRASLHAKCVVVDGEKAFIGSANFTEAAQLRNIEIGLVAYRPDVAACVERHFDGLIQHGHLRALP